MSLLDDFARPCVLLDKSRVPDGESGYITTWAEGAEFYNYQALDTSMEARRAEKEGVTSVYSVLVQQSVRLSITTSSGIKRPGETYRVTSEPMAKKPHARPASISSISRQKRRRYRHDKRTGSTRMVFAVPDSLFDVQRAGRCCFPVAHV